MPKFVVTAQDRVGYQHVVCAGRFFPSSEATIVEVLDQDADVFLPPAKEGYPMCADLHQCGREAWDKIKSCKFLSIRPEGSDADGEVPAKLVEARAQIDITTGKLTAKEAENTALSVELTKTKADVVRLQTELKAAIAERDELLSADAKPAQPPKSKTVK